MRLATEALEQKWHAIGVMDRLLDETQEIWNSPVARKNASYIRDALASATPYAWSMDRWEEVNAAVPDIPTGHVLDRPSTTPTGWFYFPIGIQSKALEAGKLIDEALDEMHAGGVPFKAQRLSVAKLPTLGNLYLRAILFIHTDEVRSGTTDALRLRDHGGWVMAMWCRDPEAGDSMALGLPITFSAWSDNAALSTMDVSFVADPEGERSADDVDVVKHSCVNAGRFLGAAFHWLETGCYVTEQERAERHTRKRVVRAGGDGDEEVLVVGLRRQIRQAHEAGDGSAPDWKCRWIVHRHRRNQYYPSKGYCLPIWVDQYVKGPPDRPLRVKQRVFEVRR